MEGKYEEKRMKKKHIKEKTPEGRGNGKKGIKTEQGKERRREGRKNVGR